MGILCRQGQDEKEKPKAVVTKPGIDAHNKELFVDSKQDTKPQKQNKHNINSSIHSPKFCRNGAETDKIWGRKHNCLQGSTFFHPVKTTQKK
jgi:hypothetical protein